MLETDWMSDEISSPDTDDEEAKDAHRRRLIRAARLDTQEKDKAVWEVVRPGFQSLEVHLPSPVLVNSETPLDD